MTRPKSAPLLLWDIDGTLLVTGDDGLMHYHRALCAVVPGAARPLVDTHGKTDWQIILELLDAAGIDRALAPELSAKLDADAGVFLDGARARLLPYVKPVLEKTRTRGLRNALLTGNSERRSRNKLTGAGLDPALIDWDASYFGSRSPDRSDLARAARRDHPDPGLLIIGDTPFDGIAAAAAGIPFLALCTGRYGRSDFGDVPSVAVLDRLEEKSPDIIAGLVLSEHPDF